MPESIIATVEKGKVWFKDVYTVAPMASSSLMTHNISVTFLIFASGITFGVGTLYLLALNGLLIGTVAALCINHNLALEFWSFLLPHGSLELTAVFIAGGAGLVIGHALIDPGPYRRSEILALRSKQAAKLIAGCIPLLAMAGLIEAFFSPSPLPAALKIIFSIALFPGVARFPLPLRRRFGKGGPAAYGSRLMAIIQDRCEYSSLTIPNHNAYVGVARTYVGEVAKKIGFDEQDRLMIERAVAEAVTTVIEHASNLISGPHWIYHASACHWGSR